MIELAYRISYESSYDSLLGRANIVPGARPHDLSQEHVVNLGNDVQYTVMKMKSNSLITYQFGTHWHTRDRIAITIIGLNAKCFLTMIAIDGCVRLKIIAFNIIVRRRCYISFSHSLVRYI